MAGIADILLGEPKGKAVRERARDLAGIWAGPVPATRQTLVRDLRVVAAACSVEALKGLDAKGTAQAAVEYLVSDAAAETAVREIVGPGYLRILERQGDGTPFVMPSFRSGVVGTHVPKTTDATVEMTVVNDVGPTRDGLIPFLSGAVPGARRRIGSATTDPAGDSKRIRFLGVPVEIEGRSMSLAEWLGDGREVADALVAGGWPRPWLDAMARAASAGLEGLASVEEVPNRLRTVYFPRPDGGYVMLTPLTSAALWAETHARIRRIPLPGEDRSEPEEGAPRRSYRTARRKVGGDQPQNVSYEAPMLMGRLDLLHSMPPKPRMPSDAERVAHRVRTSGSAIGSPRLPPGLARTLAAHVDPGTRRNARWQARLAGLLASAARVHLAGPLALADAIDAGADPGILDGLTDGAELTLVEDGFDALDAGAVASLVTAFAGFLAAPPRGVPFLAGDQSREDLRVALRDAWRGGADGPAPSADEEEDDGEAPAEATAPAPRQPAFERKPAHMRAPKGAAGKGAAGKGGRATA